MPRLTTTAFLRKDAERELENAIATLNHRKTPPQALQARDNFEAFRQYVAGNATLSHHQHWANALNTGQNSECLHQIAGPDTLILAPRGAAKSTFLTEWIAYQIGKHTEVGTRLQVVYISYEVGTSRQKSQQIQRIVETQRYQEVFPWVRRGSNWAAECWEIDWLHAGLPATGEPYTMFCTGLKGSTTGKRYHIAVFDDLIKSPNDIKSPTVRAELSTNYAGSIRPAMLPGGRRICLGTRMRADDIYSTDFNTEKGWIQLIQSAIEVDPETNEEQSYWPEKYSLQYLQDAREAYPIDFSFQYQNIAVTQQIQSINPNWIKQGLLPHQLDQIVLGVDLSAGLRESNDFTALVMVGVKRDRGGKAHYYIIDCWHGREMGNLPKCRAIAKMWNSWKHLLLPENQFLQIWVEGNSYQLSFKGDFEEFLNREELYDFHLNTFTRRGDKLMSLRSITGLFANGLVTINQYCRHSGKLILELCEFGTALHDDLKDATEHALNGIRGRQNVDGEWWG